MTPDSVTDDIIRALAVAREHTGWAGFWDWVFRPTAARVAKQAVSRKLAEADELYGIWCVSIGKGDHHMKELRRVTDILWTVYRKMW